MSGAADGKMCTEETTALRAFQAAEGSTSMHSVPWSRRVPSLGDANCKQLRINVATSKNESVQPLQKQAGENCSSHEPGSLADISRSRKDGHSNAAPAPDENKVESSPSVVGCHRESSAQPLKTIRNTSSRGADGKGA